MKNHMQMSQPRLLVVMLAVQTLIFFLGMGYGEVKYQTSTSSVHLAVLLMNGGTSALVGLATAALIWANTPSASIKEWKTILVNMAIWASIVSVATLVLRYFSN